MATLQQVAYDIMYCNGELKILTSISTNLCFLYDILKWNFSVSKKELTHSCLESSSSSFHYEAKCDFNYGGCYLRTFVRAVCCW